MGFIFCVEQEILQNTTGKLQIITREFLNCRKFQINAIKESSEKKSKLGLSILFFIFILLSF